MRTSYSAFVTTLFHCPRLQRLKIFATATTAILANAILTNAILTMHGSAGAMAPRPISTYVTRSVVNAIPAST